METAIGAQRSRPRAAVLGVGVALLAAVAAALAGLGTRWGWWDFRTGFVVLRWAALCSLAAAALSLVGAIVARPGAGRRGLGVALLGLALGLGVAWVPWHWMRVAHRVPPIHDITTDTNDPPAFEAILPLRAHADNPAAYGGDSIAALQRSGYPDLGPLTLDASPGAAYRRALAAARDMGWDIARADSTRGRIEATATTFWFGFKDDVVVRVEPTDGGSRVDVRSVSRVGRSDVGTNAARIRRYLRKVADTS